jgi:hypothetical protein
MLVVFSIEYIKVSSTIINFNLLLFGFQQSFVIYQSNHSYCSLISTNLSILSNRWKCKHATPYHAANNISGAKTSSTSELRALLSNYTADPFAASEEVNAQFALVIYSHIRANRSGNSGV